MEKTGTSQEKGHPASALRSERNFYIGPSKDKQPLLVRFLGLSHVAKTSLKILIVVIYNTRNWKESQGPSKT